jgi:hypothetical protein
MRGLINRRRTRREENSSAITLLGMSLVEIELTPEDSMKLLTPRGVSVLVVNRDSDSYRSGVRNGDTIAEVNNVRICSMKDVSSVLAAHDPHLPLFIFLRSGDSWRFINLSFISGTH